MQHIRIKSLFALVLFGSIPLKALAVPAPPPPVDEWIAQLGHNEVAKRKQARLQLQQLGDPALAKVQKAAKDHPDKIVREGAAEVAACIRRGEILSISGDNNSYWFNRVLFIPDSQRALVTGGAVIVMDLLEAKETRRDLELSYARLGLAISPDGKQFATAHQSDPMIRIGDIGSGKVTQTLKGHKVGAHAVAFTPKGDLLASGGFDGLRLWDLKTGLEAKPLPRIDDQVRSLDFSADGKQLLTGHTGGMKATYLVRVWDVEARKEIRSLKGHSNEVTAVYFLPMSKRAISTGLDGLVIVWSLETGKEVRRWTHSPNIYGAAVSPDGKRLLTAGFGDKTVRLWDIESGKELKSFGGHGGAALGVAFSRDGRLALSSDAQATVRLWRLQRASVNE